MVPAQRILRRLRLVATPLALVAAVLAWSRVGWGIEEREWAALILGGALLWLVYLPLEFALVALVSAVVGCAWSAALEEWTLSARPWDDELVAPAGLLFAALVLMLRLEPFRGSASPWPSRLCLLVGAFLAVASVLEPGHASQLAPPLVAAILLAPFGAGILLFQDGRRGTPSVKHLVGGSWILGYLLGAQALLFALVTPLAFVATRRRLDLVRELCSAGMRFMFDSFPYGRLERLGVSREELARPAVIVSNHQSSVDIPLVLSLPADIRILVSPRVWRTPILGIGARLLSHVLVERDQPEVTLERCRERMAAGASVHAFPEGTRSQDAWPARFRRGPFEIACELGAEVLPLVLHGTNTCVPRDAYWVGDFRMGVEALPRVTPESFDYGAGSQALMRHVQELVRAAVVAGHRRAHADLQLLERRVLERFRFQRRAVRRSVEREFARWDRLEAWRERLRDLELVLVVDAGYGVGAHRVSLAELRTRCVGWLTDEAKVPVARRSAVGDERLEFSAASRPELDLAQVRAVVFGPGVRLEAHEELFGELDPSCPVLVASEESPGAEFLTRVGLSASGAAPPGIYARAPVELAGDRS